jgi:hypothetical protein
MTGKIKRRSLRCGGRPKADFGSIFTTFIAPALGVAGSVADSAIAKHQANKVATTPAANTQVPEPKSNPEPKVDATGNNGTTVLPPDPTKTPAMRLGGRKKCWIGTAIMGATSIAGSLFGAAAQKREMRRQKNIQDWQNTTQEAANMTSVLNNSQDYQEDYLRQFRTAARLGKTLGAKGIYITDGGNATKIGSNTYLLRGGSHEDVNETGQTGIGINVDGNEVEAEGGEVAQKKNGALRIFSAQPILSNGMSPAQAILRGYNKDSVFSQQQAFKKRNGLKDDGSAKYGLGGDIKGIWNFIRSYRTPVDNIAALVTAYQKLNPNSNYNKQKGKFKGGTFRGAGAGGTWTNDYKSNKGFDNFNDAYDDAVEHNAKTFIFGNKRYNTLKENNPIREINNRAVGSWRDSVVTKDRTGYGKDFGPIKGGASLIPLITETYNPKRIKHRLGGGLTSKDRGSSKHPYPSVSSKDFAGGGRSYPIPTKADAVDALRLAGLHGRSDVKSKVYSKYPSLRPKAAFGDWVRTNRDDNALADLLYESGLFDRESWNTMLRDIHDFTGMGSNPYNIDDNVDAVMAPAFTSSSSRMLSQLTKSPEASYTLKQVLGLPTKEMVRKRIAGDIAKRIGVARAARQSSNFRNYNIARMQAANAEASFSPFANQVRYAEGKPILVNTNGYYTTAGNTISRNARNMTSGANPFLYAPRTSDEVLEGLNRVISSAKQGAKSAGQKVGNKFKGTPGQKLSDAYYDLTPMQRAKLKGLTLAATLSIPAGYFVESQNGRNKKSTPVQKDAHGKPISQYIARPQTPVQQLSRPQVKKVTPAQKSVVVPKQGNKTVPQYKGNTTKGNYQLHDGETRTINGIKYTRRGNAIINHKTNVAYIYDKNGNYTGKADYSKVGNFNQAFDAARAADRSQFIYRAGKYNNYSTNKETNAKKERLNRIVGARRVAKALGGYSRPVEGMRPKAGTGMYIPFNKRYTSIYDAPDYDYDYNGGNVLGNDEVTVTAKRIKPTFMKPNNDAMNLIKVPKEEVPYIPQHHNRSRTIFSGGDYLGLGIDTLAALSTGLVNYNTAGKYTLPDRAPIIQASKLPTTYNVNPEIEEVKRYRDRLTGQTFNNTSSSVAALNRSGAINLDALSNLSKLWATKENEENKMLTEDAKNQQTVAAQNVQNELARQSEIARIKNEATQAKGDALNVGLSGLSQAWTNFWTAGRTAYEDDQTRRAMIASSKEATPTRLSEMDFDLSPDILASLYRTAKDDRTRRFYLSRLSPKQRLKYGIN